MIRTLFFSARILENCSRIVLRYCICYSPVGIIFYSTPSIPLAARVLNLKTEILAVLIFVQGSLSFSFANCNVKISGACLMVWVTRVAPLVYLQVA